MGRKDSWTELAGKKMQREFEALVAGSSSTVQFGKMKMTDEPKIGWKQGRFDFVLFNRSFPFASLS